VTALDSGKYAAFVLAAYGFSAVTLLALVADSLMRTRGWRIKAERAKPAKKP
jgi:heme exporter protein CcmD